MIKNYEIFLENNNNIIDSISEKFWKMTEIVDWQNFINIMKINGSKYSIEIEKVKGRVYKNFEFDEIEIFKKEYDILYDYLYTVFFQTHATDKNHKKIYISDDSYSDMISSVIAFGKDFIKKAIKNKDLIKDIILKENYYENFIYILLITKEKYHNIRCKYDPIYCDVSKYNL